MRSYEIGPTMDINVQLMRAPRAGKCVADVLPAGCAERVRCSLLSGKLKAIICPPSTGAARRVVTNCPRDHPTHSVKSNGRRRGSDDHGGGGFPC